MVDDAEAIWFLDTLATIKAGTIRTRGALSVVEFTHPAGFATSLHVHHAEDDAFYILAGALRGVCGDRLVARDDWIVPLAPARHPTWLRRRGG